MPLTRTRRDELLIGGVAALVIGGILFARRASTVAPAAVAATIPADVLPIAGAGAGGDGAAGAGEPVSSHFVLAVADTTSALAAAAAVAASNAAAGPLGTQAALTPGTGSQVPTGIGSVVAGPGPALDLAPELYPPDAGAPSSGVPIWAGLTVGSVDPGGRLVVGANDVYNPPVVRSAAGEILGLNPGTQFTPMTARAWWDAYFANPYDLSSPAMSASLPGSLVLTSEEKAQARAISAAFAAAKVA